MTDTVSVALRSGDKCRRGVQALRVIRNAAQA